MASIALIVSLVSCFAHFSFELSCSLFALSLLSKGYDTHISKSTHSSFSCEWNGNKKTLTLLRPLSIASANTGIVNVTTIPSLSAKEKPWVKISIIRAHSVVITSRTTLKDQRPSPTKTFKIFNWKSRAERSWDTSSSDVVFLPFLRKTVTLFSVTVTSKPARSSWR